MSPIPSSSPKLSSLDEYENVTCRVASRSWALSVRPREEPMSGFPQFMAHLDSWHVNRNDPQNMFPPPGHPLLPIPDVRKRSSRNSAIATSLPLLLRLKLIHPNISFGSYLNGRFMPWRHKWDALLFTVRIHMIDHKTALSFNAIVSCECIRRHNWHSVAMWFVHCWDCLSGLHGNTASLFFLFVAKSTSSNHTMGLFPLFFLPFHSAWWLASPLSIPTAKCG